MARRRKIFIGKTIAILSVIPVLIYAHVAGPDPGKSGVPGESTCNEAGCHVGTPLNGGGGSVTIDAGGSTYTPGVKQRISVTISDPAQRRWGFQLTTRLASNSKTREGLLASIDANTQVLCASANLLEVPCNANPVLQFIEHTESGAKITAPGAGNTFQFDWTPPATAVGNITLYAAGNAANGNTTETGDHIYTTTLTLTPATASTCPSGAPKPTISGVVNGGSFKAGFAQNTFVTITGTNLADPSANRIWQGSDFVGNALPTSLDCASVKINNKDAFVYYISPTQLNVLSPVDTAQGSVSVQVTYAGSTSDAATAQMLPLAPAFFLNGNYIASRHADFSLLLPTSPAKPGDTVLLYGTGFGPTNPAIPNGQILSGVANLTNPVTMTIGGVSVTPSFAGLSATGLYQINVQVPASTPNGDIPVIATMGGVSTQSNAVISVQK